MPGSFRTVPVEPTEAMMLAADAVDWNNEDERGAVINMWQVLLTAAPVREEGGAVDRAGLTAELHDYLIAARRKKSLTIPKDLGRRLLAALATREEAPAEEGEPCEHQPGCDCTVAEEDVARSKPPLRAQPQAREESQPVGVVDGLIGRLNTAELDDGTPLYTSPPVPEAETMRAAVADIAAERQRQVDIEGWTSDYDDKYATGEMALAAACYALSAGDQEDAPAVLEAAMFDCWPWSRSWWKPTTARRDLVKAGALIVAEIERLDRAALQQEGQA